jgi:hypothetical protein
MASSFYANWEVRSQGNDNNSGCFDPNATMTATLSSSNGTSATPTVTASNYTFVSQDVGHYLFIKSGTSWTPGWYLITSISSGSAVLNATSGQVVKLNRRRSSSNGVGTTNSLSSGTWAIDYTQNNSNRLLITDLLLNTSSSCSSVANPFTPAMIGNTIRITAGTNFTAQVFVINSLSGVIATLDRAAGTSGATNGTAYMGGAMQNPYNAFFDFNYLANSVNFIYIKADGEYTWGTQTFLAGNGYPNIFGYENYRHDSGRPTLTFTAAGARYFGRGDGNSTKIRNIIADSKDLLNCYVMFNGNNQPYATITNSIFKNSVWNGASGLAYRLCAWDIVKGYHTTNSDFSTIYDFRGNTVAYGGIGGGTFGYNSYYKNCLIYLGHNNSTVPLWNNPGQISGAIIKNNYILNGTAGFIGSYENCTQFGNHAPTFIYNNLFVNNSGTLFINICGSTALAYLIENNYMHNCPSIGATSGNSFDSSRFLNVNNYVLAKSPFKDYANYNLSLNDDAEGGKIVKFDTIPTLLSPSNTSKNKDVGPIQNSILPSKINMNGGMRG